MKLLYKRAFAIYTRLQIILAWTPTAAKQAPHRDWPSFIVKVQRKFWRKSISIAKYLMI
jgi:hypothetical protein